MRPILAGLETEYGLVLGGRGVEDQIEDATALVREFSDGCLLSWDYRPESPRSDLRGFKVEHLAVDPVDARFDEGRSRGTDRDVRADRILPNGARLYNDHGHPEYATPECWGLDELVLHDAVGQRVVAEAGRRLAAKLGLPVKLYKNNTDFHGASYGSHESYLMPREIGFERLYRALVPMLVARQVLCGAGKAGFESGRPCSFQMTQRGDFFSENANVETLYRRPVFNTRDEPHADPARWCRVHVIAGDANMIPGCTRRKAGLAKLALRLEMEGKAPRWDIHTPPSAFSELSRMFDNEGRIELSGASWTTPRQIIESYLDAASLEIDQEEGWGPLIEECQSLLELRFSHSEAFAFRVDWAAKHRLLCMAEESGVEWGTKEMQSYDLAYHDLDKDESLYEGLVAMGMAEGQPPVEELILRQENVCEPTRAFARSLAIKRFREDIVAASWGGIVFRMGGDVKEVVLDPAAMYNESLDGVENVVDFVEELSRLT